MAALVQHQNHGIKSVFREQLGAPNDDRDKADGIGEIGHEVLPAAPAQQGADGGDGQSGEAKSQSTGQTGKRQSRVGALQFRTGVFHNLVEDLRGSEAASFIAEFLVVLNRGSGHRSLDSAEPGRVVRAERN